MVIPWQLQGVSFMGHQQLILHCLRYVFGSVLQQDLQEFVQDWNEHPLRKNNRVSSPHGCPNDIYDIPSLYGTSDQSQPFDTALWARCMLQESTPAPPLCSPTMESLAEAILCVTLRLGTQDITHSNCYSIYLKLVHSFEWLFNS